MAIEVVVAEVRTLKILVVDDEPAIVHMLDLALQRADFSVLTATSGLEAIGLYHAAWRSIDLVLLDVRMPRPDGPLTLASLRQINPHVRCCFMSGHIGKYSAEQLLDMGAVHVFEKPFMSLAELAQKLLEVAEADPRRHSRLPQSPEGSADVDQGDVKIDRLGPRVETLRSRRQAVQVFIGEHGFEAVDAGRGNLKVLAQDLEKKADENWFAGLQGIRRQRRRELAGRIELDDLR